MPVAVIEIDAHELTMLGEKLAAKGARAEMLQAEAMLAVIEALAPEAEMMLKTFTPIDTGALQESTSSFVDAGSDWASAEFFQDAESIGGPGSFSTAQRSSKNRDAGSRVATGGAGKGAGTPYAFIIIEGRGEVFPTMGSHLAGLPTPKWPGGFGPAHMSSAVAAFPYNEIALDNFAPSAIPIIDSVEAEWIAGIMAP